MSVLAAVTARIMELGLEINFTIISLIWISMSLGWSPTGTCLKKKDFGNYINTKKYNKTVAISLVRCTKKFFLNSKLDFLEVLKDIF